MSKLLNRLLGHIDMSDGVLFSRFNNPDYQPTDKDIDEAIERFDAMADMQARLSIAYYDVGKQADWLANQCAYLGDQIEKLGANGDVKDKCCHSAEAWRKAAKDAVGSSDG